MTEQGYPRQGVGYQVAALTVHLEIGSPESEVGLHWLGRQREALGEAAFAAVLAQHLEPEGVKSLLALLDQDDDGSDDTSGHRKPEEG
jgi:hypothetical protein